MSLSSDPVIQSVVVRAVRVPLSEPHRTASAIINESPLLLIDIATSNGVVGHSIVFTYTSAALVPCAELTRNIGELVVQQPLSPKSLAKMLGAKFRLLGTQGLVGMAMAGIDMAVWDALAKESNLPLVTLLGGTPAQVKPYGAIGFDGESGSARVAETLAKRGFRGIKAKIGYPTLEEDVAVIKAMRSAAGNDMALMVDYNQSLDPVEALRRLHRLDQEQLTWVEEPVMSNDYVSNAHLTASVSTPIQSGENWWGIADMQQSLLVNGSSLVMPDVMKIGGISGFLDAAALAHAHRIPMSNHLWPELSARLLSVTPTAHWLEYSDWWNPVIESPLQMEQGYAVIGDEPGSGIIWNEKAIAQFLV